MTFDAEEQGQKHLRVLNIKGRAGVGEIGVGGWCQADESGADEPRLIAALV